VVSSSIDGGAPALALELRASLLLLEPPLACGAVRLGRAAALARAKRRLDPLAQARQRELAVSRLAAGVLSDRGNPRPEAGPKAAPLLVGESLGPVDLEYRLDPRGGDVGVLAARPRGAARSQLDLGLGDLDQ
jgi:hypothetical protein